MTAAVGFGAVSSSIQGSNSIGFPVNMGVRDESF